MKTMEGEPLIIGNTVYIRIGGYYPTPGKWRVSQCTVVGITNSRCRLERANGSSGCWRKPVDIYSSRAVANGSIDILLKKMAEEWS